MWNFVCAKFVCIRHVRFTCMYRWFVCVSTSIQYMYKYVLYACTCMYRWFVCVSTNIQYMYMYLGIPVILPHHLQLHHLKFVLRTRLSYYNRSSPWKLLHFKHTTRKVTALKYKWVHDLYTPLHVPVMLTIFSRVIAHGCLKLTGQKRGWALTQTSHLSA